MEVALLLVAEANAVFARLFLLLCGALWDHVNLLVDLILLLKDVLLGRVEPRLQVLQHQNHELGVLRILPAIDVGVEVGPVCPLPALFLHPEVYFEQVYEVCEEEAPIDVRLNMVG